MTKGQAPNSRTRKKKWRNRYRHGAKNTSKGNHRSYVDKPRRWLNF